jgi:hypothetical protein
MEHLPDARDHLQRVSKYSGFDVTKPPHKLELRLQLCQGTNCDPYVMTEGSCFAGMPLRDVARNRSGSSPNLRAKPEPFGRRKGLGDTMDRFGQLHGKLPYVQILERNDCAHTAISF